MKTAKVQHYKVIIERGEDDFFVARVPALPGCFTQGHTYEEVIKRIREAIQLCCEVMEESRQYRKKQQFFAHEPSFIGIEDVAVAI